MDFPVEASPGHVGSGNIFKRIIRYDVNDGTGHCFPVLCYPSQQRLQPALCALAVSVQESDNLNIKIFNQVGESFRATDLSFDVLGAQQSGSDQTRSFGHSEYMDWNRQILAVFLQLRSQVVSFTLVINQDDFFEQILWRSVDDTPHRSQQCCPCFIMEYNYDTSSWQLFWVIFIFAPKMKANLYFFFF
jgi:hypothetical protein